MVDENLVFQISATIDPITNSETLVSILILPNSELEEESELPHFKTAPSLVIEVPCFDSIVWDYDFPKIISRGDDLVIEFNCEEIFSTDFYDSVLKITLEGSLTSNRMCTIDLQDSNGKASHSF